MLAACAGAQWTRPETGSAQVDRDLQECRGTAKLDTATSLTVPVTQMFGSDRMLPGPQGGVSNAHSAEIERFQRENKLVRECMEKNGYSLAPVAREASRTEGAGR
jgi:hypothetical protein